MAPTPNESDSAEQEPLVIQSSGLKAATARNGDSSYDSSLKQPLRGMHGEGEKGHTRLEAAEKAGEGVRVLVLKVVLVVAWYFSNIALLLSNKYLMSSGNFKQPVFLTLCHMLISSLVPVFATFLGFSPQHAVTRPQLVKLTVLAIVFCFSVVLGNVALEYIHVSFYQAISATTPAFTAVFALFMLAQGRETFAVYLTLVPVMLGLVIATGAEPTFNMVGFVATVLATALRALKTVLQGILLTDVDPMNLLRYMALIASVCLALGSVVLENDVLSKLPPLSDPDGARFYFWLLLNCLCAFGSNLTNFLVTKWTSPLTVQVLGNAVGVAGTVVSIIIFRNPVSLVGLGGYAITLGGVGLYVNEKRKPKLVVE